jgi:hypothetical protein
MSKRDPERETHKAWLGLLQPVGLVVAPPALIKAQVVLDKNAVATQDALLAVTERPPTVNGDADPEIRDFPRFAEEVLGWSLEDLAGAPGGPPLPESLEVALPEYGDVLRPTYAVIDGMADGKRLLLVSVTEPGVNLDDAPAEAPRGWNASPQARLERLLRQSGVPAGLLCNGQQLRLIYAPSGETSGHLTFPVAGMCDGPDWRLILGAFHMLLSEHRVFGAPDGQRLLDILSESRKYQSEVSTKLSEQVLSSLWELLRGLQAADEAANGRVLYDLRRTAPEQIYGGSLTVIMRLVFLLYAEDQGLMPDDPVYARNYSISGLYERLREDAGRYPDTMDQRYGAWPWLLSTFRLIFDGGSHAGLSLPARHGQLFSPDEYPFLEGRPPGVNRVMGDTFDAPKIADGVIWRVLEDLLVLDGERLSYRALDVEQIGSVYEAMMGFDVQSTSGRSIALRPKRVVIDLDRLLKEPGGKRAAWLKSEAECDLSGKAATALKDATTVDDLVAALERRIAPQTPQVLPPGALFLQPGEERRRSGSHYTPRELTEPIVRTTLRPVLEALGPKPKPEQILDLKVCDPAMGSGAFLVESCRQLAEALVEAWTLHDCMPTIPPDEEPILHARRLVAQRCLYGVDKNPFAVNLAKLSLWLVTLARDHAFTFLDHALKHGDSLVGLTRKQIGAFHWNPPDQGWEDLPLLKNVSVSITKADSWRQRIQLLDDGAYDERREAWREAEDELHDARFVGDLCVAAFFGADKDKDRERLRLSYSLRLDEWRAGRMALSELRESVDDLRSGGQQVLPFHWEIEFPEVFGRDNPGFDALVGNPPFLGGRRISASFGERYRDWLACLHDGSSSNADISAHFFRHSFNATRSAGTFGHIATNTIAEGDTRASGLRHLLMAGGRIFSASRRLPWPGKATVIVSVVHVQKCDPHRRPFAAPVLDGKNVTRISAFLVNGDVDSDPRRLSANVSKSFQGSVVLGIGFTFNNAKEDATPIVEMQRLIGANPKNGECIFPYLGGSELNTHPTHSHHRYVIRFGRMSEEDCRANYPELLAIVEAKVKPERDKLHKNAQALYLKKNWWQWQTERPSLYGAIQGLERVLVCGQTSKYRMFSFVRSGTVFDQKLIVFPFDSGAAFALLSSRVHEDWALRFGSSLGDGTVYTPSDCFDTFPFPDDWHQQGGLTNAGDTYYDFRALLMVQNNEGLTDTYNRFHDPNESSPDILKLRELHAAMDRAVLDAYGWSDISTDCDFFLDYEIDEETWGNKKKPYRYRWPDEVHDEVLARLLELNQKRYEEEVKAGLHGSSKKSSAKSTSGAKPKKTAKKSSKKTTKKKKPENLSLFGGTEAEDKA